MAIKYEWQILNANKVYTATAHLDDAVDYLNAAIELIKTGKSKSNYEIFHTNMGNTIPTNADSLIAELESLITDITTLRSYVNRKAESLEKAERKEYNRYIEEQNNSSDVVYSV